MHGWGDIHDVRQFAGDLPVAVTNYQNAVVALRRFGRPEVVFRAPGEPDSGHVNRVAAAHGHLSCTAFVDNKCYLGWRERGEGASVLVELASGRPVVTSLDGPHNPLRLPEAWLACNSGAGGLLLLDPAPPGRVVARTDVGGWRWGLAISADHLYVGVGARRPSRGGAASARTAVVRRSDRHAVDPLPLDAPVANDVCLVPAATGNLPYARAEQVTQLAGNYGAPRTTAAPSGGDARTEGFLGSGDGLDCLGVAAETIPSSMRAGPLDHVVVLAVRNENDSTAEVNGPKPLIIGWRWYSDDGGALAEQCHDALDGSRLPRDMSPGPPLIWRARVRCSEQAGHHTLCLSLVRELVARADDVAHAATVRCQLTVCARARPR